MIYRVAPRLPDICVDGNMQDYTEAVENKIVNKGKQHSQTNGMEIQIGGRTKTKDFDGSS